MGTTLNGTTPQNTYPSLIKVGDNGAVDATLQRLSDGEGNDLPLEVSSTAVNFTGTVTQNGNPISTPPSGVSGAIQFSDGSAFASDAANLFWDDANNRLGVGTNAPAYPLQVSKTGVGHISFIGSLFNGTRYDGIEIGSTTGGVGFLQSVSGTAQPNPQPYDMYIQPRGGGVGIGMSVLTTTARLQVRGSGTTSATNALLVQNSAGESSLRVLDNGSVTNYGKGGIDTNTAFGLSALNSNTTGSQNTAVGDLALSLNSTGARNTALGHSALAATTGAFNTAVGRNALSNNTSGGSNSALGEGCQSGNFSGSVILGKDATATAANQFVVGSSGTNAGTITTETITPDRTWTVRINGANYKIPLLAI
jgi:hypothetical protein